MTVSDTLLVAALGVPSTLLVVIYKNLESKILALREQGRTKVPEEACMLRIKLVEEKVNNLHNRVSDTRLSAKEYQEVITTSLGKLHTSVDSIRDCVTKLSAGVDCD